MRPLRRVDYLGIGLAAGAAVMATVIALFSGGKKEEEDISNIIYPKVEIDGTQVLYEGNREEQKLTLSRDGLTWILYDDGDGYPDRAERRRGSQRPSEYGGDDSPDMPKEGKKAYRHFTGAIEAKLDKELADFCKPPEPEPTPTPDPAATPAPTPTPAPDPATPGPAPDPATPGPAPDPAAPDATSAIYSGTNYKA